jgi:hypothetical protein
MKLKLHRNAILFICGKKARLHFLDAWYGCDFREWKSIEIEIGKYSPAFVQPVNCAMTKMRAKAFYLLRSSPVTANSTILYSPPFKFIFSSLPQHLHFPLLQDGQACSLS